MKGGVRGRREGGGKEKERGRRSGEKEVLEGGGVVKRRC